MASLVFLIVGYVLGWIGKDVLVIPSFVAALVCVALANLDRFKSFKAAGVEATLRDAEVAVKQSRALALITTKMLLSLVKRTGRIGGFPPAQQIEIQHDVDRVLSQYDVTEAERREAYTDWDQFDKFDYVTAILGGNKTPNWKEPAHAGKSDEWQTLRNRASKMDFPSADELSAFLARHDFLNKENTELLEDYRYFLKEGKHRRPEVWARRNEWEKKALGT